MKHTPLLLTLALAVAAFAAPLISPRDDARRLEILFFEQPGGRALEIQELRTRQRRFDCGSVCAVDERRCHAEARADHLQQPVGVGVTVPDAHNPVARRHEAEDRITDRCDST